jgi:prevent-host-death family protein
MRFVSVRELRGRSRQVWKQLDDGGDLVVTSNGKPIAVLSPVREDDLERSLATIRRVRAIDAVADLQAAAVGRKVTVREVAAEIAAVRKGLGR